MKNVCYRVTASDYVDVWFDVTDEEWERLDMEDPSEVIPDFEEIIHEEYDRWGGLELDYRKV